MVTMEARKAHAGNELLVSSCRKIFDQFDTNHDGTVGVGEIEEMLHLLGQNPTRPELKDIYERSEDECPDGRIDFDMFLEYTKVLYKSIESNATELRQSFQKLDPQLTGLVVEAKLRQLLSKHGERMTSSQIDEMLSLVNRNGDSLINYEDFIRLFTKSVQELC